jgi:hypothetical protein
LTAVSGGLKTVAGDVSGTNSAIGTLAESMGITSESVIGDLNDMMNEWVNFTTLVKKSAAFVAATVETLRTGDDQKQKLATELDLLDQQNDARIDAIKHAAAQGKIEALNLKTQMAADDLAKKKAADSVGKTLTGLDNAQADKGADKLKQAAEKLAQAYKQQQDTLQKTIAITGLTTNVATVHYEVTAGALAKLLPLQKQNLENLAKEADLVLLRSKVKTERADLDHQIDILDKQVGLERKLYDLETGKYKDFLPSQREDLLNRQRQLIVTQDYQALLISIQNDEEKRASTLSDQLDTLNRARSLGLMSSEGLSKNVASTLSSGVKLPEFGGIDASVSGAQGELDKANTAGDTLDKAFNDEALARWNAMDQGKLAEKDYYDSILKLQEDYAKKRKSVDKSINSAQSALQTEQLSNAQNTFGSLADITATFAGKNSAAYRAMFLVEKAFGIAKSIIAIQTAMASASMSLPFPANLGAIAIVAAQTASIVSTISSVAMPTGMAHDGIDYVPREGTWLLDEGERVLSPRQNQDFTRMMENNNGNIQSNIQQAQSPDINNHIYNILDPKMLGDYMKTPEGERAFINTISRNATKISQVVRNA